jgi:hypothetical protein
MALLVPNIGEVDSLRTLLNATHQIPRNLVLKLFTSNTTPAEGDVPSAAAYFEPYNSSNTNGYGSAPSTGYPALVNNRADQDYTANYGILLNGNRWAVTTASDPVASSSGSSGSSGAFQITITGLTGTVSVGNIVSGTGVASGAKVSNVSGSLITLNASNTGTVSGPINFTGGVTTATYPEQVFTFTSAAGNVYGYYLSRAQNMPVAIQGVSDAATAAATGTVAKGDNSNPCIGVVGNNFITLPNVAGVMDDVTTGQRVTGNTAVASGTTITGIDFALRRIFLSSNLTDNIQVATDSSIDLNWSSVSTGAVNHNLQVGDVIYVAAGSGGSTVTPGHYTVFSKTNTTFTTTPALAGAGNATLLPSILFAERFTNGPYPIQNNGDQIKITLNVSLD